MILVYEKKCLTLCIIVVMEISQRISVVVRYPTFFYESSFWIYTFGKFIEIFLPNK